jgi:hypothetical protein
LVIVEPTCGLKSEGPLEGGGGTGLPDVFPPGKSLPKIVLEKRVNIL